MTDAHQRLELELLSRAIYEAYGYDFRQYAPSSLNRRVHGLLKKEKLSTVTELTKKIIHSPSYFAKVLDMLTVTVTEMFRDPEFFKILQETVYPYLETYAELKVWHAGCATGEEVYSNAILLTEANLYERATIFGTDINSRALTQARDGILREASIAEASEAYTQAGGRFSLGRYYDVQDGSATFKSELKRNLLFSDHNLVTNNKFGEMNLIFCRNTLIYFSPPLQEQVMSFFWSSLKNGGFLCLGSNERLQPTKNLSDCKIYSESERIYQKRA